MNHVEQLAGQVERPSPRAHDIANRLIPALYGIRNASKIGLDLSASREPSDIELEEAVRNHVVVYVTLDRA